MFENIGDILTQLILIGIGISLLFAYRKSKKSGQLWSGIGLLSVGIIMLLININKDKTEIDIKSVLENNKPIDTLKVIKTYNSAFEIVFKDSNETKSDTTLTLLGQQIKVPKGIEYTKNPNEPTLRFSESNAQLLVNFKKEEFDKTQSLENNVKLIVKNLSGNIFGTEHILEYSELGNNDDLIIYDYYTKKGDFILTKGFVLFRKHSEKLIRISIEQFNGSTKNIEKLMIDIINQIEKK
ncbi:hypothetical protein J1D01_16940 [Seonamhaeicola sp. NFXS20]|uniref:hypothetical protein n=1 Tax=Seonamhaeicola sp. NFXS20 TaxID=2816959 RepID=UPI003B8CD648